MRSISSVDPSVPILNGGVIEVALKGSSSLPGQDLVDRNLLSHDSQEPG